jgi:hypothetical protein
MKPNREINIRCEPDLVCVALQKDQDERFEEIVAYPLASSASGTPHPARAARDAQVRVNHPSFWTGMPGWSARTLNRAIENWCLEHVGRYIQARWDLDHGPSRLVYAVTLMRRVHEQTLHRWN